MNNNTVQKIATIIWESNVKKEFADQGLVINVKWRGRYITCTNGE